MWRLLGCVVLCAFSLTAWAQDTVNRFEEMFSQGKYKDALTAAKERLKSEPENRVVLYNAGLAAYLDGEYGEATVFWSKLKTLTPEDWQVRTKLVQAYEAAKNRGARDKEIKELYELRSSKKNLDLTQQKYFCRDQFEIQGKKLMVYEHYALEGDRAVKWSLVVLTDKGEKEYVISLGSYESENLMALESGRLKRGQRLYHLDGYYNGGRTHRTYGFYFREPTYDSIKEEVKDIIVGKRKPVSSSDPR